MSRTNKHKREIRVVGKPRKEPDIRRIAKAIVLLSLDADEADQRFAELAQTEQAISKRRRSQGSDATEDVPS
jgi:hypothetical protein